ncbi:hypothetical protein J2797_004961 [Paraburkholderia terricola]|jgi:hypothetical protein|uniref:Uncharacterized protein n=1 Tax=Paraburkholderia terricola TaxID=169427 RepID=A0A1M6UGY9_9BURK|nr:hypothetical protein [Paraburkholderia terricola]SDO91640.1 hypothetical protein SAMN05192547_103270 [Paraburkholderia sediminicola]MDR6448694.1 hypothetical protein [Paraburkholderia terricola]MDR6482166.1 hypothetical protein [Paraburkholderia terricola]MDR6495045.1 hypothetical protein [Paraburkholderia terricola]
MALKHGVVPACMYLGEAAHYVMPDIRSTA